MMAKYGMPYMGSKNKIADQIINVLPRGNRLVDLFGGGGAITHCASLSNKWTTVHYNELNKLCYDLFLDAVAGKYNYDVFTQEWVSREKFLELYNTDGYIKYIWSFGNSGMAYLFGKDIENYKKILHNCVVFNDFSEIDTILPHFTKFPDNCIGITNRRLYLSGLIKKIDKGFKGLEYLERIERLQQLDQIERLQQLEQIETFTHSNLSYLDVELKDGDIVYCDPPYINTAKYSTDGFNHHEFWDWVRQSKYPVYVSEYNAPEDIIKVGVMDKLVTLSPINNSTIKQ